MNGLLQTFRNMIPNLQLRLPHIEFHFQIDRNLLIVIGLIIALVLGNGWLAMNVIAPALGARDSLAANLQAQRASLLDARRLSEQSPDFLQQQITSTKATVTAAQALFLTNGQVNQIINSVTQNANMSGIALTNLTLSNGISATATATFTVAVTPTKVVVKPISTPSSSGAVTSTVGLTGTAGIRPTLIPTVRATVIPTPTIIPTPSLYQMTVIHIQAQGNSQRLINFLARLHEAELAGVVTKNLAMQSQGSLATLSFDLALYVSPFATVEPEAIQQVRSVQTQVPPTPSATPSGPTPTPDRFYLYIVRDGDTLYTIADQFHVSAQEIVNTNAMTNLNLTKGEHLLVPVH